MATLITLSTVIYNELGKPADIIIQGTGSHREPKTIQYDEAKYPMRYENQVNDWLLERGNHILASGFDELNNKRWVVVQNEANLSNPEIQGKEEIIELFEKFGLYQTSIIEKGDMLMSPDKLNLMYRQGILERDNETIGHGLHWIEEKFTFSFKGKVVGVTTKYSDVGFTSQHTVNITEYIKSL